MIKQKQIYRCLVCGNIVEVLYAGGGKLVCCGQAMEAVLEKSQDLGQEKHLPVIEITDTAIKVKVGAIPHPMEEKHYIEWIELIIDGKSYRHFLKPLQSPETEFNIKATHVSVRIYCNLHGLWGSSSG